MAEDVRRGPCSGASVNANKVVKEVETYGVVEVRAHAYGRDTLGEVATDFIQRLHPHHIAGIV